MTINYGRLIRLASNKMVQQMDAYARDYGLTGTQISILDFLANVKGVCLQRDIEAEFNIRRSTATVLLQRMQARDLVVLARFAGDGRQKQISLTTKGKQLQLATSDYIARDQREFVAAFTDAERTKFSQMLRYWIKEEK
ncbi:MarR family winged helix-turn-helix transcriptional regulator [Lacticaseibacillus zhaodongensis]|uniref:MarR family winged helix-turn-helix transcriptional regulator n=1 Tax=Lacticaseibacillus zhaodongensis TaxID=2668065 RepID=UPI0012D33739|nr:MarR family winged helix-turn-helix transcriptional regulator [Lacticaseibacillus zhaodongensis]